MKLSYKRRQSARAVSLAGAMAVASALAVGGLFCMSLAGCIPAVIDAVYEPTDLQPPSLVAWSANGPGQLRLDFDEAVSLAATDCTVSAQAAGSATDGGGGVAAGIAVSRVEILPDLSGALVLELALVLPPGEAYALSGLAFDEAGNAISFTVPFWGYNPQPAGLVINELLSAGSDTHPDAVEFYVSQAGDLAGLAFYVGVSDDADGRYIFPACPVAAGEYIVLHLQPQGLPEEIDELAATNVSGGLDASSAGRDLWCSGAALSGKNGAVSLYASPHGAMIDAVVYCERTSASDSDYRGFGSAKLLRRVDAIAAAAMWLATGGRVTPEAAAQSGYVTATRTLCRSGASADTDSAADWHIVPTRGASLGAANVDAVHQP
ncbi:MAG TPA: hypothetical protein DCQ73_00070 [Spirochaetaceae bacterium]|nr:hypothetical protein [Spirochaetaceae bacterium]